MSMLGRTGTTVRKNRRRSSSNSRTGTTTKARRGSAPTVLVPTSNALQNSLTVEAVNQQRRSLTTAGVTSSPLKSVSFYLGCEEDNKIKIRVQKFENHSKFSDLLFAQHMTRKNTYKYIIKEDYIRKLLTKFHHDHYIIERIGGRVGTSVRKNRRRSSSNSRSGSVSRRGSAPTVLTPSPNPSQTNLTVDAHSLQRHSLTSSISPSYKSVSFSVDDNSEINSEGLSLQKNTSPSEKQFYDSTVIWPGGEECEQHYSVMNSVCEACVESSGVCEFLYRAFTIISTTWPVTVLLVILLALPLVMTSIGVNYLHDCPREPKLPIYQVVGGVFGIIKVLFLLWKQVKKHKDDVGEIHDEDDLGTMIRMTNIALNVFLTLWFFFGHYWLFSIWKPQFKAPLHEPRNWCDQTVFYFTFWQLVICHTIIACLFVVVIILFYCYCCVKCVMDENKS